MNRTSHWAGCIASFFAIVFFVMVTGFKSAEGDVSGAYSLITGWSMMLAAFAGVVCLVSGVFAALRCRKDSSKSVE